MTDAQIDGSIGFDQIERHRLENQARIHDVARPDVVAVPLHEIRPDCAEFDLHAQRLFIPQEIEFHDVAFKFSLDHFRHLHALTFELNIGVAGNGVIVDREQHVAWQDFLCTWTRFHHGPDENAPTIIL